MLRAHAASPADLPGSSRPSPVFGRAIRWPHFCGSHVWASRWSDRASLLFVVFSVLIVAAIWGAFFAFAARERIELHVAARSELLGAQGTMRAHLQRTVESVHALVTAIDLWLGEASTVDPALSHRKLAEQIDRLRSVDPERPEIRLFDSAGWLLDDDGERTEIWSGDREFLTALLARPEGTLHVGVPVVSRGNGRTVLPITFKARANALGIAYMTVGIRLGHFEAAYANLLISAPPVFGVIRTDGTLLFRLPEDPLTFGKKIDVVDLAAVRQAGDTTLVEHDALVGDGQRMTAFAFLDQQPLAVFASFDPDDLAARSERNAIRLSVFPIAATIIAVVMSILIARLIRRAARESERVRQALAEVEAANAAKGHFIAKISHELRTPLNAIIGFSEMIGGGYLGPLGESYRQYGTDIRKSGEHLLGMINQMLEIARIEEGAVPVVAEEVPLKPLVNEIIGGLKATPEGRRVSFAVAPTGGDVALWADRRMLRQMLFNLLGNAAKFNRARGEVMVAVGRGAADGVEIVVADTGIGMSAATLAQALEPFGRGDAYVARQFDGLGLGLPIAKSLVELHGGRLDMASEPGAGTVVRLRFPADRTRSPASLAAE